MATTQGHLEIRRSRRLIALTAIPVLAAVTLTACSSGEDADTSSYPDEQIQMIVPWAAGGGTDLISRQLATLAEDTCGTRIVVSNVTGAAGATGHQAIIDAEPDGYTIGTATTELAILEHLDGASFSPTDVAGIVQIAANPAVLTVSADSPYETFEDLEAGLAEGETIRVATNGPGGTWDLASRGLGIELGTHFSEYVPFDGAAEMIPAVLGGQLEAMSPSAGEVQEQIDSGAMRGLATMADERFDALPDVPTLEEQGVDWVMGSWIGSVVPAGTPDDRVEVLRDCFGEAAESEEFAGFITDLAMGPAQRDGEEFTTFINSEYERFESLIDELY